MYPTPAAAVVLVGKYFHLEVKAHYEGEGAGRKLEYPEKTNLNPGSPLQWWPTTHYATGRHNDRPWKVQYAKIATVILFKTAGEICFNTVWVLSIRVQSNSLICTCLGGILCLLVWQCPCIKVLKTLAKTRAHTFRMSMDVYRTCNNTRSWYVAEDRLTSTRSATSTRVTIYRAYMHT